MKYPHDCCDITAIFDVSKVIFLSFIDNIYLVIV